VRRLLPALRRTPHRPVVAFAGHRDLARVAPAGVLRHTLERLFLRIAGAGPAPLLACGGALGADRLAIHAWRRATGADALLLLGPGDARASYAGAVGRLRLPSHADQSQRLVDLADLLVVAWDGRPPRGPGGVADTVARARRADISVIWAAPDGGFGLRYARDDGTWAPDAVFARTRGLALAWDMAGSPLG
jgi:hypothetical protein